MKPSVLRGIISITIGLAATLLFLVLASPPAIYPDADVACLNHFGVAAAVDRPFTLETKVFPPEAVCVGSDGDRYRWYSSAESTLYAGLLIVAGVGLLAGVADVLGSVIRRRFLASDRGVDGGIGEGVF
jgi:hypothetical protein